MKTLNAAARSRFLGLVLLVRPLAVLPMLALVACGASAGGGSTDAAADRSSPSGGTRGSGGSAAVGGSGGAAGAAASGGSSGQVDAAVDAPASDGSAGGGGAGGSAMETGGAGGVAAGRGGQGGGTPQATGGAAGASSGGGAGAGGASVGGVGGGVGVCFPACLNSLARSCPTTGTCTYAIDIQAAGVNFCFANGIKAQNATLPTNSGPTTSTVKNVDGSLCYTLETTLGNAGILYAWKNSAGTTVATATVATASMNTMVVTCDGATHTVDLDSPACNGQSTQPTMTNCILGTCNF